MTFTFCLFNSPVHAVVDPLSVPNNRVGIHIISATPQEASAAAEMVNFNGDWGYITVLIESKDRDKEKWQQFFNDLRRRHLIPLVRLATKPVNGYWERPYEKEYEAWADFLDSLVWPTKNRYVIIYNEPNHAKEWGNSTDPKSYAKVLDQTITALKNKNRDFFVLNAGFDASTPHQPPDYYDEERFLREMNVQVPGIFSKLDGWVSHSYPNPGFMGSPQSSGRGTVRGYLWEMQILRSLGVSKNLPIFITETGWKHAEGLKYDPSLPSAEVVSEYFRQSFQSAWNNFNIVAVTPFLLNYQEEPFAHFSFKKVTGEGQDNKILGAQFPDYYPQYLTLRDLPKVSGQPIQENSAQLSSGEIYSSLVRGQSYLTKITFKNTGQSIWNERGQVRLEALEGGTELGINPVEIPKDLRVEPGQEYSFNISFKAPQSGNYTAKLNLTNGDKQFGSPPFSFATEVKSPVMLKIKAALRWKETYAGQYLLSIKGSVGQTINQVLLKDNGQSDQVEAITLLPDYTFNFTLEKPFYKPKTIQQKVNSGVNELDFGILEPDILSALFRPNQLWKLLPFSR